MPTSISTERKAETIGKFRQHGTDTGSPEVQVALLSERIAHLTESVDNAVARTDYWRAETRALNAAFHDLAEIADLMARVGDRMASKVDAQTAKEWAAAKDGRALRGPDGRWLKADA